MKMDKCKTTLAILHFNDVYNVESREDPEPVGGAARMKRAFDTFSGLNPLVLFCGDALSPSMLSTFTKGSHMIPVLNKLGTHCAVYGNHDFDFGMESLLDVVEQTNFPWLMSNIIDKETNTPLGDGKPFHIIDWHGIRIGLIGLVEKEWLDTLSAINPDEVVYRDFVEVGNELALKLKDEDNCDIVIALTHMRNANDIKLAGNATRVDLIFGGHDHDVMKKNVNGTWIIKSGTDFRNFNLLNLQFSSDLRRIVDVKCETFDVTSAYKPDADLEWSLKVYQDKIQGEMSKELGYFEVELDGRFSSMRKMETNLGNFVCDIMVASTEADFALLNAGTFRSDTLHPAGPFTMKDLLLVLPFISPMVLIEVTEKQILECLENGVSQWPKLEGRFPQVSGIMFTFDGSNSPGNRVLRNSVKIGDEYIFKNQEIETFRMVTDSYLAKGKDGYPCLLDGKVLIDEENGPLLRNAVQNHFDSIKMRKGQARKTRIHHHQSLITISRRNPCIKKIIQEQNTTRLPTTLNTSFQKQETNMITLGSITKTFKNIQELESIYLAPKVESRITRKN